MSPVSTRCSALNIRANCTSGQCCRIGNPVASLQSNYTYQIKAPRYGYFTCDVPWALGAAAVEAIPVLTGTNGSAANGSQKLNMTIFTGDLVSHDPYYQLSRSYIEYTEACALSHVPAVHGLSMQHSTAFGSGL